MKIEYIIGLRLESFRFSKGSYSFEFSGKIKDTYKNYQVSTNSYLSFSEDLKDDVEALSSKIWDMLETNLIELDVDEMNRRITFFFENNNFFIIWADEELFEELLAIRDLNTGELGFFI